MSKLNILSQCFKNVDTPEKKPANKTKRNEENKENQVVTIASNSDESYGI